MALALLIKIGSLFIIALGAYALVKLHVLRSEDSRILSLVMLYMITPCTVISAFQIDSTPEVRSGLILAFAAAVISHVGAIVINNLFVKKLLHLTPVEQASFEYPNAGNLIIPIVSSLLGQEWIIYTCAYICVTIVLQWTHLKPLLSGETHINIKKILSNINIIAILIGFAILAFGIKLPKIVQDAIDSVSVMIGPASMMMIGMMLAGMDLKQIFANKRIWLISFLRLIFAPLMFILFLRLTGFGASVPNADTILLITLLASSSAAAATITQMELIYGTDAEYACSINVLTTMLCIITMPLIVLVYQL